MCVKKLNKELEVKHKIETSINKQGRVCFNGTIISNYIWETIGESNGNGSCSIGYLDLLIMYFIKISVGWKPIND